jgi:hypothetical protein
MRCLRWLVLLLTPAFPVVAWGQNATFEVTESALNRLLGRVGNISKSGVYQPTSVFQSPVVFRECFAGAWLDCPGLSGDLGYRGNQIPLGFCRTVGGGFALVPVGPPIAWQWWVTDAHYTIASGSMSLTATVKTRVGATENTVTRTVPASVVFDSSEKRLRIKADPFTVPLQAPNQGTLVTVTQIDVAKLYTISVPLEPQTISIPSPNVNDNSLSMRAVSVSPQYLAGKVRIGVDVAF